VTGGRFLFVEHHPVFGGPHNRAIVLAGPLGEHGWETVAVLPDEPGSAAERFRAAGIPVETIPLRRLRRSPRANAVAAASFGRDVARLRRLIRDAGANLVVVAGFESPHAILAARLERIPAVWQIISTRTPGSYVRVMSPLAQRYADVVMTTGRTVARQTGVDGLGERWVPFFSPVDTGRFAPSDERRLAARRELGLPDDAVVVGTVGNVNPQKGHDTFVRAAASLRQQHPDVRFLILGEHDRNHDAFRRRLIDDANASGLPVGDVLHIRSPGDRVAALAPAIDIFWCTSIPRSEGVSTAVMEGMALGLPVVTTDVGGLREIVREGETGFVVPPFAADAFADRTRRLLADTALRRELGAAGRTFVMDNCTVAHSLSAHLRAFDTASAHAATRRRRL
jgi:glycosyltransferase involved in cell wall biosynthesis